LTTQIIKMRHGSLFSGIGGFDLAAEWMGWENIFQCEIEEYCNKVLKQHWPNVKRYGDIKTTDFSIHRGKIDVVTGGFPCQPFSKAGKRNGTEDSRYLWPEMYRAIKEIQPSWIVGENVYGLLSWTKGLAFQQIKSDLEAEGYEIAPPFVLPAYSVGAFHNRDRVWFVAFKGKSHDTYTNGNGFYRKEEYKQKRSIEFPYKQSRFPGSLVSEKIRKGTDTRVFRDINGIPNRVDRIKALGNAIVPQVAFEIFKAIEKCTNTKQVSPHTNQ
jgi:DNA-cytosine methyltransferase